jgi:hypothetical protein
MQSDWSGIWKERTAHLLEAKDRKCCKNVTVSIKLRLLNENAGWSVFGARRPTSPPGASPISRKMQMAIFFSFPSFCFLVEWDSLVRQALSLSFYEAIAMISTRDLTQKAQDLLALQELYEALVKILYQHIVTAAEAHKEEMRLLDDQGARLSLRIRAELRTLHQQLQQYLDQG